MKVFIDCGAFDGRSVRNFRKLYKDSGDFKIYCFEPDTPDLIKEEGVEVINKAVSDRYCKTLLFIGDPQSSSLYSLKTTGNVDPANYKIVKCIDLSSWIKSNFKPTDTIILKLNVEGAEYPILKKLAADGILDWFNQLYVNWHWNKIGMSKKEHDEVAKICKTKTWRIEK